MRIAEPPYSTLNDDSALHPERLIAPARRLDQWSTHLKDVSNILLTSLPLLGALGTGFVWLAMTFYVGTVDIRPDKAFKSIDVCTYDSKGTEFHFRSPRFQLMPGDYVLLVSYDQMPGHLYGAHVNFRETTTVAVTQAIDSEKAKIKAEKQKKWWQFWRTK
jgi:hypothetical protein